ncbi:MAG: hypothetical protein ACRDQ0_07670 [Pseudonocardia sp.]
MQPVPFPTGLARCAADQARAAARVINEKMPVVSGAARRATAEWRGGYADDFGLVMPDTEVSASELASRLLRLAAEIDDAIAAAAAENNRRANLRSEYDWKRTHPRGPI